MIGSETITKHYPTEIINLVSYLPKFANFFTSKSLSHWKVAQLKSFWGSQNCITFDMIVSWNKATKLTSPLYYYMSFVCYQCNRLVTSCRSLKSFVYVTNMRVRVIRVK